MRCRKHLSFVPSLLPLAGIVCCVRIVLPVPLRVGRCVASGMVILSWEGRTLVGLRWGSEERRVIGWGRSGGS